MFIVSIIVTLAATALCLGMAIGVMRMVIALVVGVAAILLIYLAASLLPFWIILLWAVLVFAYMHFVSGRGEAKEENYAGTIRAE